VRRREATASKFGVARVPAWIFRHLQIGRHPTDSRRWEVKSGPEHAITSRPRQPIFKCDCAKIWGIASEDYCIQYSWLTRAGWRGPFSILFLFCFRNRWALKNPFRLTGLNIENDLLRNVGGNCCETHIGTRFGCGSAPQRKRCSRCYFAICWKLRFFFFGSEVPV